MPEVEGFVITHKPIAHFGVGVIEKLPDVLYRWRRAEADAAV